MKSTPSTSVWREMVLIGTPLWGCPALSLPLLAALLSWATPALAQADGRCQRWGAAAQVGTPPEVLTELSGLAASRSTDGLLWSHQDGGNPPVVIGLSGAAEDRGQVTVAGAHNDDWEDVALGPCPADGCACLYLGDIGGERSDREAGMIYVVPEPGASDLQLDAVASWSFRYPDGPHDAEALVVDPRTGEVLVITRSSGPAQVYVLPSNEDGVTLEALGSFDPLSWGAGDAQVTGADVSPAGRQLALLTRASVLVFDVPEGASLFEAIAGDPAVIEVTDGEGVAFAPDGAGLYVVGEGTPMWAVDCEDFTPSDDPDPLLECDPAAPAGCGCGGGGAAGVLLGPLLWGLGRRRPTQPRLRRSTSG